MITRESARIWLATMTHGRCPAHSIDLDLAVARQCPLASELAKLIGEYSTIPFDCAQYKCGCPIEEEKIDQFLQIDDAI